ncbi:2-iminoacetate synthase ThiH [bacterium]
MTFKFKDSSILDLINREYKQEDFTKVLNKENIKLEDFAVLICSDLHDTNYYELLASRARDITLKRFGRVKGLYIPLYLSNYCSNECVYCGFSIGNKVERTTLSKTQIEQELKEIWQKGFRNVLLVSGERDHFKNIDYLTQAVNIAYRMGFHSISIELGALDKNASQKITQNGAESFVLYQETYHKETYKKVHLKGLKTDYDFRLNGDTRALDSGFRKVTLGFLGGLFDARFEALAMYLHIDYLRKKYWDKEFGISIPRITKAFGVNTEKYSLDNKLYARILMAFRLVFPDITISLSTRESENFRDGMVDICATHLSVESKTVPGGYYESNTDDLEQFDVRDNRTVPEIIVTLQKKGYDVHLKDWERDLNERV